MSVECLHVRGISPAGCDVPASQRISSVALPRSVVGPRRRYACGAAASRFGVSARFIQGRLSMLDPERAGRLAALIALAMHQAQAF